MNQQTRYSTRGKSLLSLIMNDHTILDDRTCIATDTCADISVSVARLSLNIEGYDAISESVKKRSLMTFTFAVDGIESGVYFTMENLGLGSVLYTVTREVTKLVAQDDQAKVKDMVSQMIEAKNIEWYFDGNKGFSDKVDFNLKCTLPSQTTSTKRNTSSSLIDQYTDAVDLATDLSSQPSFISVIDNDKLCSGHSLLSILGDTLTFDSHAISYGLVHEVKVAEKTMIFYELTHEINDD